MKRYGSSGKRGRKLAWRKDKPTLPAKWVGLPRGWQEQEMLKNKPEDHSKPPIPHVCGK